MSQQHGSIREWYRYKKQTLEKERQEEEERRRLLEEQQTERQRQRQHKLDTARTEARRVFEKLRLLKKMREVEGLLQDLHGPPPTTVPADTLEGTKVPREATIEELPKDRFDNTPWALKITIRAGTRSEWVHRRASMDSCAWAGHIHHILYTLTAGYYYETGLLWVARTEKPAAEWTEADVEKAILDAISKWSP